MKNIPLSIYLIVIFLLSCFIYDVTGQESTAQEKAIVIINTDNRSKMLLIDSKGNWIFDARKIKIINKDDERDPHVECLIYKGLYQPSKPANKEWELAGIVVTNDKEFQTILDDLQDGRYDSKL